MKLLSINADAKTVKGIKKGYLTGILYLAPSNFSGYQVCPQASKGCIASCLGLYAGRANIIKKGETTNVIRDSRIAKTRFYFEDRQGFMLQLVKETQGLIRKAIREGLIPVVRPNGSQDIAWEHVVFEYQGKQTTLFKLFPDVQWYDYTKVTKRAIAFAQGKMPSNYHITFSANEDNHSDVDKVLKAKGSVAMVFHTVPKLHNGALVIDGDETDLRFDDDLGVIVGLKAKGKAKKDTSGFVRVA